jgi:hypothetical protein
MDDCLEQVRVKLFEHIAREYDGCSSKSLAKAWKGTRQTKVHCANPIQFNVSGAVALEVPSQENLVSKPKQDNGQSGDGHTQEHYKSVLDVIQLPRESLHKMTSRTVRSNHEGNKITNYRIIGKPIDQINHNRLWFFAAKNYIIVRGS